MRKKIPNISGKRKEDFINNYYKRKLRNKKYVLTYFCFARTLGAVNASLSLYSLQMR